MRLWLLLLCCVHEDEGVLQELPDSRSDHGVPRQGCRQEADSVLGQVTGIHQLSVQDRLAVTHKQAHGACRRHIRHTTDVEFSRTLRKRSVYSSTMQRKSGSSCIAYERPLSIIPAQ